jgi:hypothetical protein
MNEIILREPMFARRNAKDEARRAAAAPLPPPPATPHSQTPKHVYRLA